MASTSNRDSLQSTASSHSSRSTSSRPRTPLSISVPPAAAFLPRPASSLSQQTHWTDVSSGSPVDGPARRSWRAREESSGSEQRGGATTVEDDDWEDEQLLHEVLDSALSRDETIRQPSSSTTTPRRAARSPPPLPRHPSPPTTPLTLPPAAIGQQHSPASTYDPALHHDDRPQERRSSFPSSEEGDHAGLGIGLGVDEEAYIAVSRRQRDDMRSRGLAHAASELDFNVGNEEGTWKQDALAEPQVEQSILGLGAGSSAEAEGLPFPSFSTHDLLPPNGGAEEAGRATAPRPSRNLPPVPPASDTLSQSPRSERSLRPSTTSASTSANSSNLSLPTAPTVDSVDLAHPARAPGTFVSVASGPMGRLAADNSVSRTQPTRGPRAFLSNLLSRSPRSTNSSPLIPPPSPSGSPATSPLLGPPRSPSAPSGWQHPAVSAAQRSTSATHARSSSLPSPTSSMQEASDSRSSLNLRGDRSDVDTSPRRTPRSIAAATFSGLARSASLRLSTSPTLPAPTSPSQPAASRLSASPRQPAAAARTAPNSPAATIGFATPPQPAHDAPPPPPVQTLGSVGLAVVPLTTTMSLSRNAQPLCGALLDDKYLLIGTTGGLDFLPLPLPGSLPMRTHGKKRKETRKPISLIKRTRFKDLAVLSDRSNILLAIAGRNDHIRVYALDGIRAMIQKRMQELDARDGYPFIQDGALLRTTRPTDPKGKARAEPLDLGARAPRATAWTAPAPPAAYQFPAASPPPDYAVSAPSPRRRPSSLHQSNALVPPASPIRPHSSRNNSGSFVTAVPTNPRGSLSGQGSVGPPLGSPRTIRGQKSRDFVASRRGSTTAVVARRKSRAELSSTSPATGSRKSSIASDRRASSSVRSPPATSVTAEEENEDGGDEAEDGHYLGVGAPPSSSRSAARRPSATSAGDSGWATDYSVCPADPQPPKLEPRSAPLTRSSTADLADFLRNSGPDGATPKEEEEEVRWRRMAQSRRSASTPAALNGIVAPEVQRSRSNVGTMPKSATSPQIAGLGLGGVHYDERAGFSSALLPKPVARDAASPRLRQGEASPMLELADLIRNSGPDTSGGSSPLDTSSFRSAKPEPRAAATPRLPKSESSPSMELAALLRGTGPSSSSSSSPRLPNGGFSTLPPDSAHSAAPSSLLGRSPALNSVETLRDVDSHSDCLGGTSASDNLFPARPPSAGSSSYKRDPDASSVVPRSSSQSSLLAPGVPRSASRRLIARKPTTGASPDAHSTDDDEDAEDAPPRRRQHAMTLDEVIRDGPPPGFIGASSSSGGLAPSGSSTSIQSAGSGGSPSNRSSKRWTMSGMSSKLRNRPATLGDSGLGSSSVQQERRSMDTRRTSWDMVERPPRRREESAPSSSTPSQCQPQPQQQQQQLASTPLPPHDFKRRTSHHQSASEQPQLPASSQLAPDAHPANSNSPLEYVKLARTKGARLLRAVETKKRTYLAVLCGDEGERIELFTGSRSISLSLNRTFVLPENPRTIEFQLQGDDLVDIYLVYPESIFALEPATVRVREVGVGRGERRARRERERRMRDIATSAVTPPADASPMPDALASSTLHPADPARNEASTSRPPTPNDDTLDVASMAMGLGGDSSRSASPSRGAQPDSEVSDGGPPPPPVPPRTPSSYHPPPPTSTPSSSSNPGETPPPVPPRSKHTLPYSTFQQLPFVPPVPSSVLSSAWIIPPLYSDVVGSGSPEQSPPTLSPDFGETLDPNSIDKPSITVTGEHGGVAATDADVDYQRAYANGSDLPLLSPISLLGGAAHRANGPPGLFFVSKGKNLSGIVTAEGKSIIKRPLVWSLDKAPEGDVSDVSQRIEMLIVGGNKTVVVGIGSSDVKAIAVGGEAGQPPFGAAIPVTAVPTKVNDQLAVREVQWLGTHAGSSQLFFAERVGQQFTVQCLFAKV